MLGLVGTAGLTVETMPVLRTTPLQPLNGMAGRDLIMGDSGAILFRQKTKHINVSTPVSCRKLLLLIVFQHEGCSDLYGSDTSYSC